MCAASPYPRNLTEKLKCRHKIFPSTLKGWVMEINIETIRTVKRRFIQ